MPKRISAIVLLFFLLLPVYAAGTIKNTTASHLAHKHSEAAYQDAWCRAHKGIQEYIIQEDKTRVDCLTQVHAVEFDFFNKWAEGIGQALYYSIMTNKKTMVVLILEDPATQMPYYDRVKKVAERYEIDTEYVTESILNVDRNGKCNYIKCKCRYILTSNLI